MIICNKCGNAMEATTPRFCAECGADMTMSPNTAPPPTIASPPYQSQSIYGSAPMLHPTATPQLVQTERRPNPLPWILVSAGILVIIVVAVVGFNNSGTKNANAATPLSSNTNTSNDRSGSSTYNNTRDPSTTYPNGHWAVCKFTPVNVRTSPNLNAQIITDIASGDRVWVIKESSNYDTVHINSLNQDVYDNWSEVEFENSTVHGWIFSAFIR